MKIKYAWKWCEFACFAYSHTQLYSRQHVAYSHYHMNVIFVGCCFTVLSFGRLSHVCSSISFGRMRTVCKHVCMSSPNTSRSRGILVRGRNRASRLACISNLLCIDTNRVNVSYLFVLSWVLLDSAPDPCMLL